MFQGGNVQPPFPFKRCQLQKQALSAVLPSSHDSRVASRAVSSTAVWELPENT